MSRAQHFAQHCNSTYAPSARGPAQAQSMKPNPGPPPTAKVAIICCMDARLNVFDMFGLRLGEAHIIRVGGGRAPDALRSLIASEHVLGTEEIMVVHHTDCGFSKAPAEEVVRKEVKESLGGLSVDWVPFMPLNKDLAETVKDDIRFLDKSPYIKPNAIISGWIYDTKAGTIEQVG